MLQRVSNQQARGHFLFPKRWLLVAFFALFPVVFAAGLALGIHNERKVFSSGPGVVGDRAGAIAVARRYLASKGIHARDWTMYCAAFIDEDLYRDLKSMPRPTSRRVTTFIPPLIVKVMAQSLDRQQHATVTLGGDNRVLGFDIHSVTPLQAPPDPGVESSSAAAQAVVEDDPELRSIFGRTRPEVMTGEKSAAGLVRKYTWRSPFPGRPEIEAEFVAGLRGTQLVRRQLTASVDRDFLKRLNANAGVPQLFGVGYMLFLSIVALYSVYSYARRAMQKEVSHLRTAWLAALTGALFFSVTFSGRDDMILQQNDLDRAFPLGFVLVVLGLVLAAGGILVGIGYGSGEGDVREAYPGKLTSLDALLLGKVFSSNVGRSIVIGSAFAAWLLFAQGLLLSSLDLAQGGHALNGWKFPYMFAPWLSFLAVSPAVVIVFAVGGLLQPLAFLNRFCSRPRLRIALLVVFTSVALSGAAVGYHSVVAFGFSMLITVTGLLLPFFMTDLLTAMVSLIALQFFNSLAQITVMLPSWTDFTILMGCVALLTIVVEGWAWRRGRTFTEEEVRPLYARHIAERKDLQAEVSAAREAQLRLLPQEQPSIPGLSVYASCLPARVVGGDFYDFYPLGDQRLGIFIAEGGNGGLAAALCIALAKGYLMHTARRVHSATEVIQRLESTLGSILEAGVAHTTVAYAIVDARLGTLSYARTGAYPKIVVASPAAGVQSEHELPTEDGQHMLWEGFAQLEAGDNIVFYTDGIARRIAARSSMLQQDWIHRLARQSHPDAQGLHESLLLSIQAGAAPGHQDHEDDLTAIVIRCTDIGSAAMGVVA